MADGMLLAPLAANKAAGQGGDVTLFDRSSQHAHGAKFQLAYVDADKMGQPQIALLCFGIRASRTITQDAGRHIL